MRFVVKNLKVKRTRMNGCFSVTTSAEWIMGTWRKQTTGYNQGWDFIRVQQSKRRAKELRMLARK